MSSLTNLNIKLYRKRDADADDRGAYNGAAVLRIDELINK